MAIRTPLTNPIPSAFYDCLRDLTSHLGKDFNTPGRWRQHPIGQLIRDVREYHFGNEVRNRELVLTQLRMLRKHLTEVRAYDPAMHDGFRRRILKASNLDAYEGIRFEVDIAASLSRNGHTFRKTEPPDFTVNTKDSRVVHIECGSIHLAKTKARDASYKISACVRKKAGRPYANASTALFIDTSAYLHRGIQHGTTLSREQLAELVQQALREAPYGNVTLFTYYFTWSYHSGVLELNYVREDSTQIDPMLATFLDDAYPRGQITRNGGGVPGGG